MRDYESKDEVKISSAQLGKLIALGALVGLIIFLIGYYRGYKSGLNDAQDKRFYSEFYKNVEG